MQWTWLKTTAQNSEEHFVTRQSFTLKLYYEWRLFRLEENSAGNIKTIR